MPVGKAIAQASHAFLDCYLKALTEDPENAIKYREDRHGTKVTLKAKNLNQMLRTHEEALACGLCAVLIEDSGHICPPDFDGSPIITALGIGPATRAQIGKLTKKFNCY